MYTWIQGVAWLAAALFVGYRWGLPVFGSLYRQLCFALARRRMIRQLARIYQVPAALLRK